ncbi:MAG: hypothetical protein AB7O43_04120 [Hyphomicrobiaceae bacterium]
MLLIGLVCYVMLQFAVGVWMSRRTATDGDYILAGRTLGTTLVAFSVFATWFGAEAIVATTGEVYSNGLAGALIDPLAYGSAVMISGLVFAAVLWRNGLTTFADLFARRYSSAIEKLVVIVLLPGSLFWAAAQIRAFGQVLSSSSGMSLAAAITLAAFLVAAYITIGGLLADAVTDFLQGLVVIAGLVVLAIVVATHMGGIGTVLASVEPERLSVLSGGEDSALVKLEHVVVAICGSLVAVELISRYLGARSAEVARIGTISGACIYLAVGMIPVFLGLAASVLAASDPAIKSAVADSEQIVAALAQHFMPTVGYVIFAGAIVSAILSNVHATLHAPAAQVSHNVIVRLMPALNPAQRLVTARLTAFGLAVITWGLALTSERIKELVETASAFGSAGVFVTACFAMFSRIGGPASAAASIIAGAGVWAVGQFVLGLDTPYMLALAIALAAYLLAAAWEKSAAQENAAKA